MDQLVRKDSLTLQRYSDEELKELDQKNLRSYRKRIKEADEKINELESRIEELREIEQKEKVLFPFQKKELLNKELELLETKFEKGANLSRVNMVKGDEQSVEDLHAINRELKKKIKEKEQEQKEFYKENLHENYKGIGLYSDPRKPLKKSMKEQGTYDSLVNSLDKMIKKLESGKQLKSSIERRMKIVGDVAEANNSLPELDGQIKVLKELKSRYERHTRRGYRPKLREVEQKLKEWREKEIERLEAKEELKSTMLD